MSRFTLLAGIITFVNIVLSGPIVTSSLDTQHHGSTRRWDKSITADGKLWADAVCKGGQFMDAFKGTDEDAGKIFRSSAKPPTMRSSWQGDLKSDMATWGWEEIDAGDEFFCDYETFWKYDAPYDALGLSKKPKFSGLPKKPLQGGGDNICYEVRHGDPEMEDARDEKVPFVEQSYQVNGEEYSKTGANHKIAINHVGGVVTAQFRLSALHAAKRNWGWDPHSTELPALRSSADLLWGFWYRDNTNIKNIRYFWAQAVSNEQTASIIASSLKMWGKELSGWPGTTFSTEDDEGMALLGSPNAISFGYFLIGHKRELGNKMITKVRVFWGDEKGRKPEKDRHPELREFHLPHEHLSILPDPRRPVGWRILGRCCSVIVFMLIVTLVFYVEDVPEKPDGQP